MDFGRQVSQSVLMVAVTVGLTYDANISLAQPVVDLSPGPVSAERVGTNEAEVGWPCGLIVVGPHGEFTVATEIRVNGRLVESRMQIPRQFELPFPLCWDTDCPSCFGSCPDELWCGGITSGVCFCGIVDVTLLVPEDQCHCKYISPVVVTIPVPPGDVRIEVVLDPDDVVPELDEGNNVGSVRLPPVDVPTVSEWGLVVLALLLLTGIAIKFGRRRSAVR